VILSLNGTLTNLWLNGNELERVEKYLSGMFASFQHLRLGSNPLHCGCEATWLKEFYDNNVELFKGASQPSCNTPLRLKGKYFNELINTDFRCQAPVFSNIDIMFNEVQGRLKCSATGDPTPTLFWIQPTGKTSKYDPPSDESVPKNEGLLVLHSRSSSADHTSLIGMYICVANNDAGNVTLAVNVSWPHHRDTHHSGGSHSPGGANYPILDFISPSSSLPVNLSLDGGSPLLLSPARGISSIWVDTPAAGGPVERFVFNVTSSTSPPPALAPGGDQILESSRMFSVAELVGAIVATHVFTLLLALVFIVIYYRRRIKQGGQQQLLPRADPVRADHYGFQSPPNADKNNSVLAADVIYHNTTNRSYLYPKGTSIIPLDRT